MEAVPSAASDGGPTGASPDSSTPAVAPVETSSATPAASAAPVPGLAHAAPVAKPRNVAALCAEGVPLNCTGYSGPTRGLPPTSQNVSLPNASSSAPNGADPPSSWTNITPTTNPTGVEQAAMAYYPTDHEVILFGGYTYANGWARDTWAFADGAWTPVILNKSCTATTCPSPRGGAMMAFDPARDALVLFGGYNSTVFSRGIIFDDTWLFQNGTWSNITATAGTPPSPRFAGAMVYDPSDNYDLLFGGSTGFGSPLGDTWAFADGTWENLTSASWSVTGSPPTEPYPRSDAAIANSPSGWVLMYGGISGTTYVENACDDGVENGAGEQGIAWWFHDGAWTEQAGYGDTETGPCMPIIKRPESSALQSTTGPEAGTPIANPPCGRIEAALGWSPKNNRFVLYGGYGPSHQAQLSNCSGTNEYLADTWLYNAAAGGGFSWINVTKTGTQGAKEMTGYAADFSDGYFETFGGTNGPAVYDTTWRFFEPVHVRLTGPGGIDTGGIQLTHTPFTTVAFGGSGDLVEHFALKEERNGHALKGSAGCAQLASTASFDVPYNGTTVIGCSPNPSNFNVFKLTVFVSDALNASPAATAEANWTFTVSPPSTIWIQSEYITDFFTGLDVTDQFWLDAAVNHGPAVSVSATIGGTPISFTKKSGDLWEATYDMGSVAAGAKVRATAQFGNWTLNATYTPQMIESPGWLASLLSQGGTPKITSSGPGPYNKTYTVTEVTSWNLASAFSFPLDIPLMSGLYSMIPSFNVTFTGTSSGHLSLTGNYTLSTPSINLGIASIDINASISVSGNFAVAPTGAGVSTVQWESASLKLSLKASATASVPIYGFSILGVDVGFYLDVTIAPAIALKMVLAPTTNPSLEVISGVGLEIAKIVASFSFAISASVNFGIGIASIGLGLGLSVALNVGLDPSAGILAGWVNGSIFVTASFLWWSDSWNITSGTIATIDPPTPAARADAATPAYDNGTTNPWHLTSRYFVGPGYDAPVWDPATSAGPAILDVYPTAQLAATPAFNGAYLFYSDYNASNVAEYGYPIDGLWLNGSSNVAKGLPPPPDPGYLLERPEALTLSNGTLYVLWSGLPYSEADDASPLSFTTLDLQGGYFDPADHLWSGIHTWTTSGIVQSYSLDAAGNPGTIVALTSDQFLLGTKTPEQLLEFSLTTGAEESDVATSGWSEVVASRGTSGDAVVVDLGGNYSVIAAATGAAVPIPYTPPSGDRLVAATFVRSTSTELALLYRGLSSAEIVLVDLATSKTLAAPVPTDVSSIEASYDAGSYYVFAQGGAGIDGWSESGGAFDRIYTLNQTDISAFGFVHVGRSIDVYYLESNGNSTAPLDNLEIAEVGVATSNVEPDPAAKSAPSPSSAPSYLYPAILGGAAAAVGGLLAVVAIRSRPPRGPAPTRDTPTQAAPPSSPPETAGGTG